MSKTQIVLATGEVYDVEDKGERRILIPVGYIKQEEEKHEQSDFDGTFNTGSAGEIHTGTGSDGDCKIYACGRSKGQKLSLIHIWTMPENHSTHQRYCTPDSLKSQ